MVKTMKFMHAADSALAHAMAADPAIIYMGEDVRALRRGLYVRFGGQRVRNTPISEAAFLGAAVTAAMGGLRPVVELYMADFLGVAADALLNHASKTYAFSGGTWNVPLVLRAGSGGGYGDGGQHAQSLWGWLAHIPGLSVVVPSTPADVGGLMLAALEHPHPVVFLEPKLLGENWLDFLGGGRRKSVSFDVPADGAKGPVPNRWEPLPLGRAALRREGNDLTIVSLGVGVHRALEAADELEIEGIQAEVIDLRSVSPLDKDAVINSVAKTGRLLVVDEDYLTFGLTGELAAITLEAGLSPQFARVAVETTLPYNRELEAEALPNVGRILEAVRKLSAG